MALPLSCALAARFAALLLVCMMAAPAQSADITMEPFPDAPSWRFPFLLNDGSDLPAQKVRLTGEIVPGDAEKLRAVVTKGLQDISLANGRDYAPVPGDNLVVVSFDSPGGDFRTGIEIGKVIRELSMPTLVENDASCLSACAVAFMSGYLLQVESDPERLRVVEAGGRLGFHRPFFVDIEGFDLSSFEGLAQSEIDEVMSYEYATFYDLANELIQEMLAVDARAWSNELLLQMLLAKQDQSGENTFVYLDKVGQAIAWGIQVTGVAVPQTQDRFDHNLELWNLCINSAFQDMETIDWQDVDDFEDASVARQSIVAESTTEWNFTYDVEIWGLTGEGCKVTYSKDGTFVSSREVSVDLLNGRGLIHLYKATTPITDIAIPRTVSVPTELQLTARLKQSRLGQCRIYNGANLVDQDPCTRAMEANVLAGTSSKVYTWPSGNQTIVAEVGGATTINGNPVDFEFRPEHDMFCEKNLTSGNTFCYGVK